MHTRLSDAQNIPSKHNYSAVGILGLILSKRGYQEIWDVNNAAFIDPNKYLTPASSLFCLLSAKPDSRFMASLARSQMSNQLYFVEIFSRCVRHSS